jgi:hypothetical protein
MYQISATKLAIGCQINSIGYWLLAYEYEGRRNGYTPEQIAEYGEYIQYFASIMQRG